MRTWVLGAAALALIVAGCGNGDAAGAGSVSQRQGSSETVATAADPCAGRPGCTKVADVDVDGDGALDAVGISVQRPPADANGPATVVTRVAVAGGPTRELTIASATGQLPGGAKLQDVFVGAFSISRAPGADLVIHNQVGQGNADQFTVVGWQAGELMPVPRPPDSSANYSDPTVWYMQESHGKLVWVTCGNGGTVTLNTQSAPEEEGIPIPGGGILESDHWAFDNGTWTPTGSENTAKQDFSYDFDVHKDAFKCEDKRR